jgi:hypothetical protein
MMIQRQEALSSTRHLGVDMNNIFKMLAISAVLVAFSACNSLEQVAPTEETQQVTPVEDTQTDADLTKMYEVVASPMQSENRAGSIRRLIRLDWNDLRYACDYHYGKIREHRPRWVGGLAWNWQCFGNHRGVPIGQENNRAQINFHIACSIKIGGRARAYPQDRNSYRPETWVCYR